MDTKQHPLSIDFPEMHQPAKSYEELLAEHCARKAADPHQSKGRLITVHGLAEGKDAYNPSGPFSFEDAEYLWFRVESRDKLDAVAMLAKKTAEDVYELVYDVPALPIEDPFISFVSGRMVVGGVEVFKDEHDRVTGYRTVFYQGASFRDLKQFAVGPDGMKDIRMAQLTKGRDAGKIHVFTRPFFPIHSRMMGRIATTTLSSLEEIDSKRLSAQNTQWVQGLFIETEWGGVNDVYELSEDLIGALCHISRFDSRGKRNYAAAAMVFNRANQTYSPLQIIADRGDFPMGPVKIMPENVARPEMHDDLADVVFSSRLTSVSGNILSSVSLELTCGLSDATAGIITIPNPFSRIINTHF